MTIKIKYLNQYYNVLISKKDYKLISKYTWWIINKNGYMVPYTQIGRKTIIMARLIKGLNSKFLVDHKNGNPLDNRRCNLRFANHKQNSINCKIKISNKSGYSGIDYRKSRKKYRVTMRINGIKKSFGHFNTLNEAIIKRKSLENK